MSLRSRLGAARRRVITSFHSRLVPMGDIGPIVSFSFDDFPRTAYDVGGAILKGFRARGTYYVAMGLMNVKNDLGEQFQLDSLKALVDDGHELASHTFNHLSCRAVPFSRFQQDVRRGREAIREFVRGSGSDNFAYPYGDVTLEGKKLLGPQFTSCRGTCKGLNGPYLDLNLLRANSLYGDMNQLESAERMISENRSRKGWLIFYTHDVQSKPSRFGCTPQLLEATIASAAQHGMPVLTVAETMASVHAGEVIRRS
jgi:peptidoglycan/xylan/chitin deacetylase (PgdA/CDA1 family)